MNKENRGGFTLVEFIIVIIILGILAALAMRQFTSSTKDAESSTKDAEEATLKGDLALMRIAIDFYYHQHDSNYPGALNSDGTTASTNGDRETSFVSQLTQYTNKDGEWTTTKDSSHPFGPYLLTRSIAENPLPDSDTATGAEAEIEATADSSLFTATITALKGWKYSVDTGQFIANNEDYDDI